MNDKLCVTSGSKYTDIDVLACAIAFAELKDCIAFLPGVLNATIPNRVRQWNFSYTTEFPTSAEQFVIVDVSAPAFIPKQISHDKIIKIYDHRPGFEDFWGERGQIEFIGSCATMIYELFGDKAPTATTANLLATAIFANTLNFKAGVTTIRDIAAYKKLKQYTNLPENWVEQYYADVEKTMLSDIQSSIENDTKILADNLVVGQMEQWDATTLLNNVGFQKALEAVMSGYENWFMNMPSIKHGQSYFIAKSESMKNLLTNGLGVKWTGDIGIADKLYLRKEIFKICKILG